jgi:hypothetical protein
MANDGLYLPGKFFKLGYVTGDLAAAEAVFARRFGVLSFQRLGKVALAYRGEVLIELIETDPAEPSIYRAALGESVVSFHHNAYLLRDRVEWDRLEGVLRAQDLSVALHIAPPGMDLEVAYVDTTQELGHYVEFIYVGPAAAAMFDQYPRY